MDDFYRVLPHDPSAPHGAPGHPLFVPAAPFAPGRVDNPDLYRALYLSDTPEGAIGEALTAFPVWDASVLIGRDGHTRALARFRLRSAAIRDLDDPTTLTGLSMKPSNVATPDREVTQAWARRIFEEGRWTGVSWWSLLDARWASIALWRITARAPAQVEPLTLDHPALVLAARALHRPISSAS